MRVALLTFHLRKLSCDVTKPSGARNEVLSRDAKIWVKLKGLFPIVGET